ncbi:hypothetical protein PSQ39_08670 [Curvibacter sp. HBC28]|jgi:hypothetical protein|uniref:DUF2486 family protein n=1 Tax=Curvibacter microcysteis TaxID=3026419 RepID=A0ABT5MDN3_9BURK|nr:hypothetical protein [Curvibacter sp. HBC28]MDD0814700.1 hypothetical protein [Curvibacter sp. HBC28]
MSLPPRTPPKFVPTLTEVVEVPVPSAVPIASAPPLDLVAFEEQLLHRVMQRLDALLEQRVQQALARVVEEQTRSVVPRLREELETVLGHALSEVLAQELAGAGPRRGE